MPRRAFRHTAPSIALLLLGLPHIANAQKPPPPNNNFKAGQANSRQSLTASPSAYYAKNAVIHSALGSVFVGYASRDDLNKRSNHASPTVSLVKGGSVAVFLIAYNHSIVNINGGSTGSGGVAAFDNSTINIKGGSMGNGQRPWEFTLTAAGSSKINLFGTGLRATPRPNDPSGKNQMYTLSGKLSDGSSVDGKILLVCTSTGAHFTLNNTPDSSTRHGSTTKSKQ